MSEKLNVSVCSGHELANALYFGTLEGVQITSFCKINFVGLWGSKDKGEGHASQFLCVDMSDLG